MGKKKEPKATIYGDIRASIKERFEAIAEAHGRKLNAELDIALERYCREEEKKLSESEENE